MVLKLYGHNISAYTKLVAMILHEKEVLFEFHQVNLLGGEHLTPEHATKHPFKYVPYIDDDGYVLYESRAIVYYIATKYANQGTPLIPTDLHSLGLFHQALAVETTYFNDSAEKIVNEGLRNPIKGIPARKALLDELVAELSGKLDVYDVILSKQRYVAGDYLTLADLIHVPVGSLLRVAGTDVLETKPNVARWFREISERPSWRAVKGGIKYFKPEVMARL
ncbi:hypothetical protein HYPSUDRAFT_171748 [Hypholoma sublateritium FD-334 SS-4]|uniref:glutathione transferase n=1 Tax=Hypholoma sublateritium (strain FD-334 SS-4) TaxID=945553 RepID=A0A0D2NHX0_HYPSF|nr:hypothetical protein HYPSUDRAFT_171748 [Hypholoma sublateritium FD-334 SS-4]